MTKNERILQIQEIIINHPDGITRSEIARRLQVDRSTIGRDIDWMSQRFSLIEDDDRKLFLDKRNFLSNIQLTMFEMEALHLAAKLFQKVMKFPFPHGAALMRKLAHAQGKVSKAIADRMKDTAELIDRATPSLSIQYQRYQEVIEKLGVAISEYRPVLITHFSQKRQSEDEYSLLPITLEPHPEGRSVHLIGWTYLEQNPFFRTLKIERISNLQLCEPDVHAYEAVPLEEISKKLGDAWSIWTSGNQTVEVVLFFSKAVAKRVGETQWHPSQELISNDDGSLVWKGRIAEPREMYPWIRSWGADVQIIEPGYLRDRHIAELELAVEIYKKSEKV